MAYAKNSNFIYYLQFNWYSTKYVGKTRNRIIGSKIRFLTLNMYPTQQ